MLRSSVKPSPPWLQTEFVGAGLTVEGYRVRVPMAAPQKLSLRGSDDPSKDLAKWDVIPGHGEEIDRSGDDVFRVVRCQADRPYTCFRLVVEEPRNQGLQLAHFDLFGIWEPDG
jgi:hypothetical protein